MNYGNFEGDLEKKESILFKKLNVVYVYIFIFLAGIIIVFTMTSYLNSKVKEFSDDEVTYTER